MSRKKRVLQVLGIDSGDERLAVKKPAPKKPARKKPATPAVIKRTSGAAKRAPSSARYSRGELGQRYPETAPSASARKGSGKTAFAVVSEGPAPERALARTRVPLAENTPSLPSRVTGSFDATRNEPVTFKGKQPFELTSNEMADFGDALGVPNIGPLNYLKVFNYTDGDEFVVPGGTEGIFTLEDMFRMKGEAINPDRIEPSLHRDIQAKLMRSMEEDGGVLSDARVIQGLHFGLTSPNQPLLPNQLAMSRLRPVSMEELDRPVEMRGWDLNDAVGSADRRALSRELTDAYGLGASSRGGLGVSGSIDYSRLSDMNDLFARDPAFFHRADGENWVDFVERVNNQLPGMGNKTTSFGVAWQPEAAVSAIDRHMVQRYADTLLADPARRAAFEARTLNLAQNRAAELGQRVPQTFADVNHGTVQEVLLSEVSKAPSMRFRNSKGDINPRVPTHLAEAGWPAEPFAIERMGDDYKAIVAANEAASAGSGLHLFGNQWNVWDRIRQRLEPHENMFPGLERIPRMSVSQLAVPNAQHALSGHKNYSKILKDGEKRLRPTRKVAHEQLRYFKRGGFAVRD